MMLAVIFAFAICTARSNTLLRTYHVEIDSRDTVEIDSRDTLNLTADTAAATKEALAVLEKQPDHDFVPTTSLTPHATANDSEWWQHRDDLMIYGGVQVLGLAVLLGVSKHFWPEHDDHWALADTLISTVIFPWMAYLAVSASLELKDSQEARWHGRTSNSHAFLKLGLTRMLLHVFMILMIKLDRMLFITMALHHILSMVCAGNALIRGTMHYWGCLAGVCEITSMFLTFVWLCKEIKIRGSSLQSYVPALVYGLNGLLLWLSFIAFRIVLFPYWLVTYYQDIKAFPDRTWDVMNPTERYMYPAVVCVMLGLSAYWMVPVTKGVMKGLGLLPDWDDSIKQLAPAKCDQDSRQTST